MKQLILFPLVAAILACNPNTQAEAPVPSLRKIAEFDLPGPPGKRFDYLTIDSDDHYLISAHLAAGQTYVIDLRTNKVVADNLGHSRSRRCRVRSTIEKLYTSNAGDNTIGVVDLRQMKVVKKIATLAEARWKCLCGAV